MIRLEKVTPDNWRSGLCVREDQREFVADSAGILARAWAYREYRSRAFIIYNDAAPVGMAMYHDDPEEEGALVFDQFFIDARYQGRGFGLEAARLILNMMEEDESRTKVYLCYIDGDAPAKNLYEKLGFRENGEADEDEIIMEKPLR
ncbi:MAG: GNAT family N-acetyltransferase [Clostridiales bacterium]|nr:GNAT family N-acetyltransferase [Clostridiales bacterium]